MATRGTCRFVAVCAVTLAVTDLGCSMGEGGSDAAAAGRVATPQAATRTAVPAAGDPVWHYQGHTGPSHWGSLSPKFAACGDGRNQSPIDIATTTRDAMAAPRTRVAPAELRIAHHAHIADGINNGHTIQVNYAGADTLTLGDASYGLAQYHFHAPSEHTVAGKGFPMEMHMVHNSADRRLAVVAVFIAEGRHNKAFDPVWANLPAEKGVETHLPAVMVDVDQLLPAARTSYRYDGSLTTPPCSEGVQWVVMTTPIELSGEQIRAFTRLITGNNRPVQPLNGRTVLTDAVTVTSVGGGA